MTRTLARVGATRRTRSKTFFISALLPMMELERRWASTSASSSRFLRASSLDSRARLTRIERWSRLTGLVRKSKAPARIAATASSMVPCPVSTMTGRPG